MGQDLLVIVTGSIALASVIVAGLIFALHASQRRDIRRLSAWMEREPEHPEADVRASNVLLDRTGRAPKTVRKGTRIAPLNSGDRAA